MKRILSNPISAIVIIFVCPSLTLLWLYSFRIPETEISHLTLRNVIIILSLVSILISFIWHAFAKTFFKGLILSTVISEVVYLFTFTFYALSDPIHWRENLTWLMLMVISVAALSLPMSVSIAYGCGVIFNAYKKRNHNLLDKMQ